MQPAHPCSAPACWWQTGLLAGKHLAYFSLEVAVRHLICEVFVFFSPPGYVAVWDSKTPHRPTGERVSWCLETFPPSWLPPRDGFPSLTLLSLFLSFIVCPTSFWREWTAFLVPGVLCQHSEVVLWNLLSVQMIFRWICGGESDFPILFLHHLRTTPPSTSEIYLHFRCQTVSPACKSVSIIVLHFLFCRHKWIWWTLKEGQVLYYGWVSKELTPNTWR